MKIILGTHLILLIIGLEGWHATDVGMLQTYWNWTSVAVKYDLTLLSNVTVILAYFQVPWTPFLISA